MTRTELKRKLLSQSGKISDLKSNQEIKAILLDTEYAIKAHRKYQRRQFWRMVRDTIKDALADCPKNSSTNTLSELRKEAQATQKHGTDTNNAKCCGDCSKCFRRVRLLF